MHGDPVLEIATDGESVTRLDGEDEPRRLLPLDLTGRVLGDIDERTVRRLIAAGELEGVHLGSRHVVVAESIDAFVERQRSEEQARRAAKAS